MKKIIWVVVIVVIVLVVWKTVGNDSLEPVTGETKVMKVGAILPLSGPIASSGGFAKDGIEEAVKDLMARADGSNIEVIFEDGQYDSKASLSAYSKLKNVDGIKALIVFGTPSVMPIVPMVNADKIPLLGLLAAPVYSTPNDYTFRLMGDSDSEAKFASDILVGKLGKKKIAVMYLNNDYGTGALASFKKYVGDRATVVAEEGSAPGNTDYRQQLTKIKATNPDAIFLATLYKEGGLIIKQAKEMGLTGSFLCGQPCDNPDLISTAGAASEGLIVVTPTNKTENDFIEKYEASHGMRPSYLTLRVYDGINILSEVAKLCENQDFAGECLKDKISGLKDFPGLSYPINFDAEGDINDQFMIKVIKDGKYVPYE